jgi:hypothetical protein
MSRPPVLFSQLDSLNEPQEPALPPTYTAENEERPKYHFIEAIQIKPHTTQHG